jgi:4-hydroxy-tetrahydrodipicolinate synthase
MLTKRAKETGADGALVVVPYYNRPTQAGLYAHFRKIAEEVDIPIVIYNIPSRTGVNILPETVAKLARLKSIVGIKEASGDMGQVKRIIEMVDRKDFIVTSGNDSDTLEIMRLGGVGVISVASNIVPERIVELVEAARRGDWGRAERIHSELLPLFKALFIETNPVPVKTAMRWMGMPAGGVRLPLVEMEPENQRRLQQVMVEMGLLAGESE